jgi:hypothetical protein
LEVNFGDRRNFQLIIGLKFLAYYGITFDCADIRLQIFKRMSKDLLWQKNIEISWNVLSNNKINAKAQKDVIRRNEKWEKSEFDLSLSPNSLVDLLQNTPSILFRNTPVLTGSRNI